MRVREVSEDKRTGDDVGCVEGDGAEGEDCVDGDDGRKVEETKDGYRDSLVVRNGTHRNVGDETDQTRSKPTKQS